MDVSSLKVVDPAHQQPLQCVASLPTSQFPTSPLPPCQPCRLTQACLAALDFIVTSSARYNVEDGTLTLELQQLGLPRSNSNSVARAYRDGRERLREALGRAVVRVRILSVPGSASCSDGGHVPSPILLSTVPGPPVPPPSLHAATRGVVCVLAGGSHCGLLPPARHGDGVCALGHWDDTRLVGAAFQRWGCCARGWRICGPHTFL